MTDKSKSTIGRTSDSRNDSLHSRTEKPYGLEQHVYNIIVLGSAHIFALYYCYIYHIAKLVNPRSVIFEIFYNVLGGLGTTVGCHRYWTHKTFKANMPLQILLMMMQTIALQWPIHKWCRDHRIHHKYTDTEADPHNSKRGFCYSHIGWVFLPKSKELKEKLRTFDIPDLEHDPIIRFQSKWYPILVGIFHYLIPISVYCFVYDMPFFYGFLANCRGFVTNFHITACVNSVAHLWGDKPYDKTISSVDNKFVAFISVGEGWHNYHHTFPWDYRASEYAWKLNLSTMFIDFFAWIGWAWDLKTVPETLIHEKMKKSGDGYGVVSKGSVQSPAGSNEPLNTFEDSRPTSNHIWGWDDENITYELRQITRIHNPK